MKQAIILAGGKGERLRPFTEERPKAMVELLGNPIMAYQMHWLRSHGYKEVVVACGYRHEVIQDYFGDGEKWGMRIKYHIELEPLGRGGALKAATGLLPSPDSAFLAVNGDSVTNLNLDELACGHREHGPLATIVTVPLRSPYGIVDVDDRGFVVGFREKPELPFGINAGIYMLEPALIPELPDRGDHEETTFPRLAGSGKLRAHQARCFWRTVDTVKDLGEVRSELESVLLTSFFKTAPV